MVLRLSAITTALTAGAEMRHARDLWQHEREVYYELIDARRSLDFDEARGSLTDAAPQAYFEKINGILGSSSERWAGILQNKSVKPRPLPLPPG